MKREELAAKIKWEWIIWSFGLLNIAAMLPQLYKILTTKIVAGISLEMYFLYGIIQLAFAIEGFFKRNTMLCVCMLLSAMVSASIIASVLNIR